MILACERRRCDETSRQTCRRLCPNSSQTGSSRKRPGDGAHEKTARQNLAVAALADHTKAHAGPSGCYFDAVGSGSQPHWKLAAIERYAGTNRPLAWIDDAHDDRCRAWAAARPGPTLLVTTEPGAGLVEAHAARLEGWARQTAAA